MQNPTVWQLSCTTNCHGHYSMQADTMTHRHSWAADLVSLQWCMSLMNAELLCWVWCKRLCSCCTWYIIDPACSWFTDMRAYHALWVYVLQVFVADHNFRLGHVSIFQTLCSLITAWRTQIISSGCPSVDMIDLMWFTPSSLLALCVRRVCGWAAQPASHWQSHKSQLWWSRSRTDKL